MNDPTSKSIASVAVCVAGTASMWLTKDSETMTGMGWAILGLLIIWGSDNE